jgi:hypothetical protein
MKRRYGEEFDTCSAEEVRALAMLSFARIKRRRALREQRRQSKIKTCADALKENDEKEVTEKENQNDLPTV